jgi:stage V sporulation protein G
MQITDIRVRQVFDEGKMKARVSITLDNQFVVHEIKVIEGENGVFIAMPSKKLPGGEFKDIAHPINRETRVMFQKAIIKAYEEKVAEEAQRSEQQAAEGEQA